MALVLTKLDIARGSARFAAHPRRVVERPMPRRSSELVRYTVGGDFGSMINGSPASDATGSRSAEHAGINRMTIGEILSAPTVTTINNKNFSMSAHVKNAGGVSSRTVTETAMAKPPTPISASLAAAARRGRSRCWGSA